MKKSGQLSLHAIVPLKTFIVNPENLLCKKFYVHCLEMYTLFSISCAMKELWALDKSLGHRISIVKRWQWNLLLWNQSSCQSPSVGEVLLPYISHEVLIIILHILSWVHTLPTLVHPQWPTFWAHLGWEWGCNQTWPLRILPWGFSFLPWVFLMGDPSLSLLFT